MRPPVAETPGQPPCSAVRGGASLPLQHTNREVLVEDLRSRSARWTPDASPRRLRRSTVLGVMSDAQRRDNLSTRPSADQTVVVQAVIDQGFARGKPPE